MSFCAEEERDKAVFYAENLKIAENKRIEEEERNRSFKERLKEAPVFQVKETKTISFEVEPSYRLIKPEYMIGNFETLFDILQKDDKELYEWASKRYKAEGTSYLSDLTPILRKEKTYDYILAYMEDELQKEFLYRKSGIRKILLNYVPNIIIELMKSTPWKWKKKLKRWLSKS